MLSDKIIFQAMKLVETETVLADPSDGRGRGALKLIVRRGANGVTATWFATWKRAGQRRKKSMGRFPDMGVREARAEFLERWQPAIMAGGDIEAAERFVPTVAAMFEGYVLDMRSRDCRSADEVQRALVEAAEVLGADALAVDIEPADIAALLGRVHARGAVVQADRLRAYLSAAFAWAIKSEHDYRANAGRSWGVTVNPVIRVPRDTTANKPGERALSAPELAQFWRACSGAGFSLEIGSALLLVVCCGQRILETLRAKGADFDLQAGTWTLPRSTTKGGKEHVVPLPAQALPILAALIARHGDGPLFPAAKSGRKGKPGAYHIAEGSVSRAVSAWVQGSGLPPFTPRDLRRTWKSRTADAGIERFLRDLIQQHAKGGDTGSKFYDRADYLPQMRAAMEKWAAWLEGTLADDVMSQ